jgi:hypothetical protein
VRADGLGVQFGAAVVLPCGGGRALGGVAVSPVSEAEQDGLQCPAGLGKDVLIPWRVGLVQSSLQYTDLDELTQPGGQDVAARAGAADDLVEAALAEYGLAQGLQGPPLPDHVKRVGDRAVPAVAAAAVAIALFALHTARHRNPVIDPGLFRVRNFSVASVVLTVFSGAFGGMLLSIVLWEQNAWGWSALRTGLAVAPGPIMVPLFSTLVAGRLIRRFGFPLVAALGSAVFGGGLIWWFVSVTLRPDYASGVLGGMIITGIGVGLTIPTLIGAATSPLPPQSAASGSAAVNTFRQVGTAIGVALLVAVIGTPHTPASELAAYDRGWIVLGVIALAGGVVAVLLHRPSRATRADSRRS